MKKPEKQPTQGGALLYTAKELNRRHGIDLGVLKTLERNGLVHAIHVGANARPKYNIAAVKEGLGLLAQMLPINTATADPAAPLLDMSQAKGWMRVIRKAIMRHQNLPAAAMASNVYAELQSALSAAALHGERIAVPGVGKLALVAQCARQYTARYAKSPVTIPAHKRWKFTTNPKVKEAVRQRTTTTAEENENGCEST